MIIKATNCLPERFMNLDEHQIKHLDYDNRRSGIKQFSNKNPILLLLHGLGASSERWLKVVHTLSKYFRVIIPDIIGFGDSDKPTSTVDYNIDFFIEFLRSFLDKLHINRPIICGHSFGGYLAAEFAIRHPDQVDKLILTAPTGPRRYTTSIFYQYITAALNPIDEYIYEAFKNMAFNPNTVTSQDIADFKRRMNLPYAKFAFMSTVLGIANGQTLRGRLSKIRSPTLIIWGENDEMTPPYDQYLQEYNEIPNPCIQKMNHCGHTPFVEKPIRFNASLLKFLTGKELYSLLSRQMNDDAREKEKNLHMCKECHQCAQCGCIVECPLNGCLYGVKTFRISQCRRCQEF